MPTDLDDQLTSYFRWIEREVGLPMHKGFVGQSADRPAREPDLVAQAQLIDAARDRARHLRWWTYAAAASLIAGLVVAVAAVGSRQHVTSNSAINSSVTTSLDMSDTLAPGAAEPLPASPLAGRIDPMAVWTGSTLIVWGGSVPKPTTGESPFGDGAMYDPLLKVWTMLPAAPISPRSNAAAVWTGTEMLIWGGSDNGSSVFDGAAYSPTENTWRELPTFDLADTIRPTTIWTGSEMIVFEGFNGSPHAGAYNPATNTWRTIATPPGRSPAPYPQAVWTGTDVIALLTTGLDDSPIIATYNPTSDVWEQIPTTLGSGQRPKLLWTGSEVLAFAMSGTAGGAWNPATRTWRTTAAAPTDQALDVQPVWTGTSSVFWNGGSTITTYDPTTDTWTDTAIGQLVNQRGDGVRVWANGILLTWGGFISNPDGTANGANDGIAWRPNTGS